MKEAHCTIRTGWNQRDLLTPPFLPIPSCHFTLIVQRVPKSCQSSLCKSSFQIPSNAAAAIAGLVPVLIVHRQNCTRAGGICPGKTELRPQNPRLCPVGEARECCMECC